jgi:hypothetical protein
MFCYHLESTSKSHYSFSLPGLCPDVFLLISSPYSIDLNHSTQATNQTFKMSWGATGGGDTQWEGGAAVNTSNDGPSSNDFGGAATGDARYAVDAGDAGGAGGFGDFGGGGNRGGCFNCGEEGLVYSQVCSQTLSN